MTRKDAARSLGISEAKFKKDMAKTKVRWASRPIHALQKRAEFIADHLAELRGRAASGGRVGRRIGYRHAPPPPPPPPPLPPPPPSPPTLTPTLGEEENADSGRGSGSGCGSGSGSGSGSGWPSGGGTSSGAGSGGHELSFRRGADTTTVGPAAGPLAGCTVFATGAAVDGGSGDASVTDGFLQGSSTDGGAGDPPFPLVTSSRRCAKAIETLERDLATVTTILGELKRHPHKYPRFKLEHLAEWGAAERVFYKKYKK